MIMVEMEEIIGEEQCSFCKGRGCVDQIFTLRQLCEKVCKKVKLLYPCFMDLGRDYERVDRKGGIGSFQNIWSGREKSGGGEKFLQWV